MLLIGGLLTWLLVIFPLIDKLPAEPRGNAVTAPIELVATTSAPDTDPAVSPQRGCELGCTSSTAAKALRKGKITASNGLTASRIFQKPKKSKRIIVNKFRKMLDKRCSAANARGVTTTAAGLCTSGAAYCGEQWCTAAMNTRCTASGDVYAGGRGRCSEYPDFKYTLISIRQQLKIIVCGAGFAALALPTVPGATRGTPGGPSCVCGQALRHASSRPATSSASTTT